MGKLRTIRDRLFAWMGVLVVLISAGALSVFVVVQAMSSPSTDQANTNTAATLGAQTACSDSSTEATLPAPDTYTPTGPVTALQETDLIVGNGAAAKNGNCLVMKYYGTLAANGKLFDENFTKPTGFAFVLGQGQVIQGWDQGLVGMKVGGTRRLVIPAALAYGSQANGAIPANSDLVFVVKLLRIQ